MTGKEIHLNKRNTLYYTSNEEIWWRILDTNYSTVCQRYSRVCVLVSGSIPPVDVNEEDGHGAEYDKGRGEVVTSLVTIPDVDVTCGEKVLIILQVNIY